MTQTTGTNGSTTVNVTELATSFGVTKRELLSEFAAIGFPKAMSWDSIPAEAMTKLETVRDALAQKRNGAALPGEPPLLEDEPAGATTKKRTRKKATALTKTKKGAVESFQQVSQQMDTGIEETLRQVTVQQNVIRGAELATLGLATIQAVETQVFGQGLVAMVNQKIEAIANSRTNFDIDSYLAQQGIQLPTTVLEKTQKAVLDSLGKLQAITDEVLDTSLPDAWTDSD